MTSATGLEDRDDMPAPVLLMGAPRSGTTWLHRLMLEDPRCCGMQESHFFVSFGSVLADFDRKLSLERPHGLGCSWKRPELVQELRQLWWRTMRPALQARPGARVLLEKTPDHALHLDAIHALLPGAKFIHVVRDSRAVCASLLAANRSSWGRDWAPGHAEEAARTWNRFVGAAETSASNLPDGTFLRVRYEDLHEDAIGTLGAIMDFIGLDHTESGLGAAVESVERASIDRPGHNPYPTAGELEGKDVVEPEGFIRNRTSDAWRSELSRRQAAQVWRTTRPLMETLGYDRNGPRKG
ncbi:MAG: sulfotransferase [Phycisphaerales bacterium]|nr:sulfotransferase [Phycisphaerales bacterium]